MSKVTKLAHFDVGSSKNSISPSPNKKGPSNKINFQEDDSGNEFINAKADMSFNRKEQEQFM
jgi:hypothetical protein